MQRQRFRGQRRGGTLVEFAIVCPVVLFLLFTIIVGGHGVFRYQQVAALAREGARWASVHGGQYAKDKNKPAATATDIASNIVLAKSVALQPDKLSCTVNWNSSNWPLDTTTNYENPVGNTVTVTVSYQWFPEMYIAGPITLTSSSTAQMLY
jgi:Flp pilus assembly protein TadG